VVLKFTERCSENNFIEIELTIDSLSNITYWQPISRELKVFNKKWGSPYSFRSRRAGKQTP